MDTSALINDSPHIVMVVLAAVQMLLYAAGWVALVVAVRTERAAVTCWAVGWAVLSVGLILLASRDGQRGWWTFTVCNIAFVTGYSLIRLGLEQFVGIDHRHETLGTLAVAAGILLMLGPSVEAAPWRVMVIYGAGAWVMLRVLFLLHPMAREFGMGWALLVAVPILMLGLSSAYWATLQALDFDRLIELHRFTMQNVRIVLSYLVVAGLFNLTFVVLVMLRQVQRLRAQNERDALTGLYNRRALEGALTREWQRFERSHQAFSVLMIDIDHFKRVNDTHGHAVGDVVIQQMADRIRSGARTLDMPTRYGGEEFLVLMPLCDATGAAVVAERIRASIEATAFTVAAGPSGPVKAGPLALNVTVSVGVATADPRDHDGMGLVARADKALYAAKHAGRNRVEIAVPPSAAPTVRP